MTTQSINNANNVKHEKPYEYVSTSDYRYKNSGQAFVLEGYDFGVLSTPSGNISMWTEYSQFIFFKKFVKINTTQKYYLNN